MTVLPPLPERSLAASWWEATRERRLELQRCRSCHAIQHYPRPLCTSCHGEDLEVVAARGDGVVYSYTVVHRAPDRALPAPYVIGLIRLDEGPVLLSRIVHVDAADLRCDLPVTVAWEPLDDGRALPVFTVRR